MGLLKWSKRPAAGVEARAPGVNVLRGLVARATTPLLPDDYLHLINPLWSARELRGKVLDVTKETDDTATVTIRTGWGFPPENYKPGQYVGIGLQIDGRWHWRSYSLTSIGSSEQDKTIAVTVKANPPDGFLSSHLVDGGESRDHHPAAIPPTGRFSPTGAGAGQDPLRHRGQRDHPGHRDAAPAEVARADAGHRPHTLRPPLATT